MLVTLTALIALATPVVLDLPSTADGEERFVSGQGCSVTVKNDQVTGPSGCTFVVAIIDAEGNVQRTQYALKTKTVRWLPIPRMTRVLPKMNRKRVQMLKRPRT